MRVLHLVKTADGAAWAAAQANVLVSMGIEVHVALPNKSGKIVPCWEKAGAKIHEYDCRLEKTRLIGGLTHLKRFVKLVESIRPDIIHSHFVTTTMLARMALGRGHRVPILFQIPGPLHLESPIFSRMETALAGRNDYWMASSKYTYRLGLMRGIPKSRLFLSYYGLDIEEIDKEEKTSLNISLPTHKWLIGNINYMYPPKYYLFHSKGIKRHEDVIDVIALLCRQHQDIFGVIGGGQWGSSSFYETRLRARAERMCGERIIMAGNLSQHNAHVLWRMMDCAVHLPSSENCGGVIEPLLFGLPTVASDVGGLSEVIINRRTGYLVKRGDREGTAQMIMRIRNNYDEAKECALLGNRLIRRMFDVRRTAREVNLTYWHILNPYKPRPIPFDSLEYINGLSC